MKTPLETRGSRANDGRSARLGKKQPDGTQGHRIAYRRVSGGSVSGCDGPAHSGQRLISGARNASARGNQRVSSFPLTGGLAALTHYGTE